MAGKADAAGVKRRRRVDAPALAYERGDFITDGVKLYEVRGHEAGMPSVLLLQDATDTLEETVGDEERDVTRVDLLAAPARWRKVKLKVLKEEVDGAAS